MLALGTVDDIKDAFGETLSGSIDRIPVGEADLRIEDGVIVSLFRQALVRCLAKAKNLASDKRAVLWDSNEYDTRRVGNVLYHIHNSVLISLRFPNSRQYTVIKPSLFIEPESGGPVPEDIERTIKLGILSNQYNARFNAVMETWRQRLVPKSRTVLEFPSDCGSTFRFRMSGMPVFVGVGKAGLPPLRLRERDKPFITQGGVELAEPALVFANRRPECPAVRDVHPIRGIAQNRAFDYGLTRKGFADRVSLGIVCSQREGTKFERYFRGVLQQQTPTSSERDYLIDFPGFQTAFGLSLNIPACNGPGWMTCPEPPADTSPAEAAVTLGHNIIQSLFQKGGLERRKGMNPKPYPQ